MWQRGFVGLMIVVLVFLLGCGIYGATAMGSQRGGDGAAVAAPPPAVEFAPRLGTTGLPPDAPVSLAADHAHLTSVTLHAADGSPVPGAVGADGRSWRATAPLRYGTTYTWGGQATGEGGTIPLSGSFSTVDPATTTRAQINIDDGQIVGVAAPIIVQFDHHVADKAAAERAMTVQTSVPTPGSWAWLDDDNGGSRAHWRPQSYWSSGTQVTVTVHQFGVDDGDGVWGARDVASHFTIGRAQIVRADVNSHEMLVIADGKTVMDFPASYGLGSDPNRNTTNGVHVVMSKAQTVLMSNPKYGYNNVPEHWAVRIENNGEFIHANPLTDGVQGSENVTHGCVNLSTENAEQYFDTAIFGDPVEVTNSPVPLTLADGDIADWTVPWNQWTAMSALAGHAPR